MALVLYLKEGMSIDHLTWLMTSNLVAHSLGDRFCPDPAGCVAEQTVFTASAKYTMLPSFNPAMEIRELSAI